MSVINKTKFYKISKIQLTSFVLGFISGWIILYIIGLFLTVNSGTFTSTPQQSEKFQSYQIKLSDKNKQISDLQDTIRGLKSTIQNLEKKIDRYEASSAKCHKISRTDPPLLGKLVYDQLKIGTFELKDFQGFWYDVIKLEWSEDCRNLAFLIQLPGRDGPDYADEKYKPRGLYIYDDKSKKILTVKLLTNNSNILYYSPYSNYWTSFGTYVFQEITYNNKNQFSGTIYEYNPEKQELKFSNE